MTDEEEMELVRKVNELIKPYGCKVTGIGPNSVGVQGDARAYGPSLTVSFPEDMSHRQVMAISTEIINKVPGVTRILQDIPLMQIPEHTDESLPQSHHQPANSGLVDGWSWGTGYIAISSKEIGGESS